MRCEDVRPLLPELAEGALHPAGPVEAHLATCAACSAELGRYHSVLSSLASLRQVLAEPPPGFVERMMALVPPSRWHLLTWRLASDGRVQVAAASVGGLLIGAAAVGMLRRRVARRGDVLASTAEAG